MSRHYQSIQVSISEHIATVLLNNPKRKNALSAQMVNELIYALEDAYADNTIRVLVFKGAGGTRRL